MEHLTTEKLLEWQEHKEQQLESPDYRAAYCSRVPGLVRFGLKVALNAEQINTAVVRMKVLSTPEPLSQINPTPISREDFHKLLQAGQDNWKAWLLCGLNFCRHLDEVCQIKWSEIDLKRGSYASIRTKTLWKRIPQAATLWPETIAALQAIPRRGQSPHVFTSIHGRRFNRATCGNEFADLKRAAEVTTLSTKGNLFHLID